MKPDPAIERAMAVVLRSSRKRLDAAEAKASKASRTGKAKLDSGASQEGNWHADLVARYTAAVGPEGVARLDGYDLPDDLGPETGAALDTLPPDLQPTVLRNMQRKREEQAAQRQRDAQAEGAEALAKQQAAQAEPPAAKPPRSRRKAKATTDTSAAGSPPGGAASGPPEADLTEARRLHAAGLHLVPLHRHQKRPVGTRWNSPSKCVKAIDDDATGYGLPLAINKLASLDPDNAPVARIGLNALGFDLDEWMAAGVQTTSDRPGSGGRSTFAEVEGLSWVKFSTRTTGTALELRAHSPNLQDTVPGIVYGNGRYPDYDHTEFYTQGYKNGKWLDKAPALPAKLRDWWLRCSTDIEFLREQQRLFFAANGIDPDEIRKHLAISVGQGTGAKLAFASPCRVPFNERHEVADILARHDYSTDGERWAPPSASGSHGVRPIPGKEGLWQSDHASDPLHGTFDAWVAHVVLDHQGDLDAAVAANKPRDAVADLGAILRQRKEGQGAPAQETAQEPAGASESAWEGAGTSEPPEAPGEAPGPRTASEALLAFLARPARPVAEVRTIHPVEFNVEGWLQRGQHGTLVAPGNTGKTTLLVHQGICHALGEPFLGLPVRQGVFVLLSRDDTQDDLDGVLAEMVHGRSDDEVEMIEANVKLIGLKGTEEGGLLESEDQRQFYASKFAANTLALLGRIPGLVAVAIDTLRQFSQTDTGNEQAMSAAMAWAGRVASLPSKPSAIVVHHTGKEIARSRVVDMYAAVGTSAIADNSRFCIVLQSLTDEEIAAAKAISTAPGQSFLFASIPPSADWLQIIATRGSLRVKRAPPVIYVRDGYRLRHLGGVRAPTKDEKAVLAESKHERVARAKVLDLLAEAPRSMSELMEAVSKTQRGLSREFAEELVASGRAVEVKAGRTTRIRLAPGV